MDEQPQITDRRGQDRPEQAAPAPAPDRNGGADQFHTVTVKVTKDFKRLMLESLSPDVNPDMVLMILQRATEVMRNDMIAAAFINKLQVQAATGPMPPKR
jgi:hypothetical protein